MRIERRQFRDVAVGDGGSAGGLPPFVDDPGVGDGEDPRPEGWFLAPESGDALHDALEHLAEEVFGVGDALGPSVGLNRWPVVGEQLLPAPLGTMLCRSHDVGESALRAHADRLRPAGAPIGALTLQGGSLCWR